TKIYILNSRLNPLPIGMAGDIFIGGPGVCRGYLERPEMTADRLIPDLFTDHLGARMYRTGDLGRWRADGNIEFLGRSDTQVKIRGFRVEPGEIEFAMRQYPGVKDALVLAREDRPGDRCLVGYLIPDVPALKAMERKQANVAGPEIVSQWKDLYDDT